VHVHVQQLGNTADGEEEGGPASSDASPGHGLSRSIADPEGRALDHGSIELQIASGDGSKKVLSNTASVQG